MYTINKTGKEYPLKEDDRFLANDNFKSSGGEIPKKDYELVGVSFENFYKLAEDDQREIEFFSNWGKEKVTVEMDANDYFRKGNETLPEFFLRVLLATKILIKKQP